MAKLIRKTTTVVEDYVDDDEAAGLEGTTDVAQVDETTNEVPKPAAAPELVVGEEVAAAHGGGELGEIGGDYDDDEDDEIHVIVNGRRCYCAPSGARGRMRGR